MAKRRFDANAKFQSIRDTSKITGLSVGHIRELCRTRQAPCIMRGQEYRINLPLFLRLLDGESLESLKGGAE
jgi:hypothetical protein